MKRKEPTLAWESTDHLSGTMPNTKQDSRPLIQNKTVSKHGAKYWHWTDLHWHSLHFFIYKCNIDGMT